MPLVRNLLYPTSEEKIKIIFKKQSFQTPDSYFRDKIIPVSSQAQTAVFCVGCASQQEKKPDSKKGAHFQESNTNHPHGFLTFLGGGFSNSS
jgi:hypothetical protein